MSLERNAANVIKRFEGYTSKTYWDVNAWRLGYGSDTLALPDGSYRSVKQSDTTTPELAQKDLERRISREFLPAIRKAVGEPYWSKLPEPAKVALISITYNYGVGFGKNYPRVVAAARSGDLKALSQEIANLQTHNAGINRKRRLTEASLVASAIKIAKDNPKTTVTVFIIIGLMIIGAVMLLIYRKKIATVLTKT
jgi:GH24 family phage-related lysozyme (muramidase)